MTSEYATDLQVIVTAVFAVLSGVALAVTYFRIKRERAEHLRRLHEQEVAAQNKQIEQSKQRHAHA